MSLGTDIASKNLIILVFSDSLCGAVEFFYPCRLPSWDSASGYQLSSEESLLSTLQFHSKERIFKEKLSTHPRLSQLSRLPES